MSRLGFSNEDFLNLLIIYGECGRIIDRSCRVFTERFPDRPKPTKDTIRRLLKNCIEHGSFLPKVSKNKPLVDNENAEITVLAYFRVYSNNSLKDAQIDLNLSASSIHRILVKHKWNPFKYYQVQHLREGDLALRTEFCEWFLMRTQEFDNFTETVIWTDEAKFCKNGLYNRHNSHFWAPENPRMIRERAFQDSWSFNVFCAIKNDRILCLFFYDENLNSERYLQILRNVVGEALRHLPPEESRVAYYQMDGAPPHSTNEVSALLYEIFEDRWIANRGPFRYPPRSPDLTPLDFFVWGYIKNKVYEDPVTTKENMMCRVRSAFNNMRNYSIRLATNRSLLKRITLCLRQNGSVFEQLL